MKCLLLEKIPCEWDIYNRFPWLTALQVRPASQGRWLSSPVGQEETAHIIQTLDALRIKGVSSGLPCVL